MRKTITKTVELDSTETGSNDLIPFVMFMKSYAELKGEESSAQVYLDERLKSQENFQLDTCLAYRVLEPGLTSFVALIKESNSTHFSPIDVGSATNQQEEQLQTRGGSQAYHHTAYAAPPQAKYTKRAYAAKGRVLSGQVMRESAQMVMADSVDSAIDGSPDVQATNMVGSIEIQLENDSGSTVETEVHDSTADLHSRISTLLSKYFDPNSNLVAESCEDLLKLLQITPDFMTKLNTQLDKIGFIGQYRIATNLAVLATISEQKELKAKVRLIFLKIKKQMESHFQHLGLEIEEILTEVRAL